MKTIRLFLMLLFIGILGSSFAQDIPMHPFVASGTTKPAAKQYEQYNVGVQYFINLSLPDVEKAPAAERKVLSAVRDTVLKRTVGFAYIKGDKDYTKLTKKFEDRANKNLVEMMTPFEEDMLFAYKWYLEYSGFLTDNFDGNPLDKSKPFFSYYLVSIELVGNTLTNYQMLLFNRKTGKLLALDDLLELNDDSRLQIWELMMEEFRKKHPQGSVDYEYNINENASFEIDAKGLNFYILKDNLEDPLDYIFLSKDVLAPFIKKGGILDIYWNN